jgi:plasmid stabilization system protein ParE
VTVKFTPAGRSQFLAALAYIRRENPQAAQRFRQRAENVLKRLERFPNLGRRLPEFPDLPHREVIVGRHRFCTDFRVKSYGSSLSGTARKFPKFLPSQRAADIAMYRRQLPFRYAINKKTEGRGS